jgi:putative hydrolase of the HAD superfamily
MSARIQQENPGIKHDLTAVRQLCLKTAATEAQLDPSDVVEICHRAFLKERNNVMDHLLPGALEVLQILKEQGIQLGALSNGNAVVQDIPILCDLFDFAVNPETAGAAKPNLQPFNQSLLLSCAISPSQMIHVGDSFKSDVAPAKRFGCRAVWVKTGSVWSGTAASLRTAGTKDNEIEADVEMESLSELPEVLRRWGVLK